MEIKTGKMITEEMGEIMMKSFGAMKKPDLLEATHKTMETLGKVQYVELSGLREEIEKKRNEYDKQINALKDLTCNHITIGRIAELSLLLKLLGDAEQQSNTTSSGVSASAPKKQR